MQSGAETKREEEEERKRNEGMSTREGVKNEAEERNRTKMEVKPRRAG